MAVALGRVGAEQRFLGGARGLHELRPLRRAEFAAAGQQPFLDLPGQRGVHVVAAQHQVIAHGDAPQRRALGRRRDLNQREIGGAAADVHHQHQARVFQRLEPGRGDGATVKS